MTCGIVIYDKKRHVVRTCGARSTHVLIFNDDHLVSTCSCHHARIGRAIPALRVVQPRTT